MVIKFRNFLTSPKFSEPLQLAYESFGRATSQTPLVILHGLLGSKNNWKTMAKALQAKTGNRQVVCVDARNHGDSPHDNTFSYSIMAQDVHDFLVHNKLAPAILMGHSMGGRTAMLTALTWPDLIKNLIVVDISPLGSGPSLFALPQLFKTMRKVQVRSGVKLNEARAIADQQMSADIPEIYLRQFILTNLTRESNGTIRWKINLDAIEKNFEENLARFPRVKKSAVYNEPTLFIGGALSDYLTRGDESGIRKLFPQAEFEYIQNAGHWVHGDQPMEFMNTVSKFINKIS